MLLCMIHCQERISLWPWQCNHLFETVLAHSGLLASSLLPELVVHCGLCYVWAVYDTTCIRDFLPSLGYDCCLQWVLFPRYHRQAVFLACDSCPQWAVIFEVALGGCDSCPRWAGILALGGLWFLPTVGIGCCPQWAIHVLVHYVDWVFVWPFMGRTCMYPLGVVRLL